MIKRPLLVSLLTGCALATSVPAWAQDAEQTPADAKAQPGVDDIIVTANRRAENVQKVPISISVLNTANLTNAGISSATQLQITTTNMQVAVLNAQPLVYIRGMGSANLNAGSESPVGLYLDGVYLPWATAIDSSFLDIERVEVLKGPQGTLYGRNTTAGAINFITRDPAAKQAIEAQATLGTWGTQRVMVYGSTGPGTVSASIAGQITRHNPFMKNLSTGPDFNDRDEKGGRAKVKFQMSDSWTATASVDYTYRHDFAGNGFVSYDDRPYAADPATGGNFTTIKDDPRHTYANFQSRGDKYKNFGAALTIRGELPFADFVSISGYRDVKLYSSPDADASDLSLSNFDALNKLKSYSQEFQLISNGGSDLDWIIGVYAFGSQGGLGPVGVWDNPNPGNPSGPFGSPGQFASANLVLEGFGKATAYAGYAQASYPILEGLKLTAGIRYSWERRELTRQRVTIPALGDFVFIDVPHEQKSWDSFDPKIGIDYSFGRNLLYASFNKGFRSGGYAIASPGAAGPVNPEKVTAFEIGGKHTLIPGVRFNWAAFHYKYKDLQVAREVNNGQGALFSLQNASDAKIKGFEAELAVDAVENLTLTLGVGYTDAKFGEFDDASAFVRAPSGYGYVQASVDVSGMPLARAPKWTISNQATYRVPLADGQLEFSGNVYFTTKYYLDTPSNIFQDKYALVNARVTYTLPGDNISVSAFVNNLTNKTVMDAVSTNQYAFIAQPNDPRIIGGTISLKY